MYSPGVGCMAQMGFGLAPAGCPDALIYQQQARLCRPPARRRPSALATSKSYVLKHPSEWGPGGFEVLVR